MAYEGSCHCGAVSFTVDADLPTEAIDCNCSHCRRKSFLWSFHTVDQVSITGDDATETYTFNTRKLQHRFCATCGTQAFAGGIGPDGK